MSDIANRLSTIKSALPQNVVLVAVSKFHNTDSILEAYNAGQRIFGESRAQELKEKYQALPRDIKWHFIGHIQTNKVRTLMPMVNLFHSVDSPHLLKCINQEANRIGIVAHILLQVHVAKEETKFGFSKTELFDFLNSDDINDLHSISIDGIMGMASNTDDIQTVSHEFDTLSDIFKTVQSWNKFENFNTLSMGMSNDYPIAISHGSNMVRIGTDIFGVRQY